MSIAGPPLEANSTIDQVDKASYAHRPTERVLPAWPTALLASSAATLIATGATPLLSGGGPQTATAAALVGTVASAGIVTAAVCRDRRQQITASAQASLERIAGPVHRFRARRWRGGLIGTPQLVRFRYQPAAVVANKTWPTAGAAVLADVLGARYRISRHDPRLGRITLRLKRDAPTEAPSIDVQRATTMMQHLFGQTASIQITSDTATLSKVVVHHESGVKATFPIWRERVERVVTTMLEGRWRARWDLRNDKVTFELRPQMESLVHRPAPTLDATMAHLIPLGVDEDGDVVSWDLESGMPHLLVAGKTGKGKSLELSTNIITPRGWTTMGELRVGSVIMADSGQPTTVTGVYDQPPGRECFEVCFSDGARITADAEHLWWTEDRSARVAQWPGRPARDRRTRLAPHIVEQLRRAADQAAANDTITIPEAASMVGCSPTSQWLYQTARLVPNAVERTRVVNNAYREQIVTQAQTVRIFDGPAVVQRLLQVIQRSRRLQEYRSQVEALRLDADITITELADQTGIPRSLLWSSLSGPLAPPSRLERRQVLRQVPARTVTRTFGTTTAYPTRAFLTALADRGDEVLNDQRHKASVGRVRTTSEIASTLKSPTGHLNHSIPVAQPLDLPPAELLIPPYTLGAWLGDGFSWGARITSADPEIIENIEADGFRSELYVCRTDDWKLSREYGIHGLRSRLSQLGLLKRSTADGSTKRVPAVYLRGSIAQRQALLAGLLDTDGTVSPQGTTQFTTVLPGLADDVEELILSLGYRVSRLHGLAKLNGRVVGPKWTLAFTTADPVFRLTRKLELLRKRTHHYNPAKNKRRYITDVRPVPEVPMRCITVDSPSHLFLAGRAMIPTHNTVVLRGVVLEAAVREIKVWACDPKRVELIGLRGFPNVQVVATTVEEQIVTLLQAWDLMEERYAAITDGAREDDFDLLVLVVDEFAEFSRRVSQWWSRIKVRGMPTACPVMEKFDSLVRLGRTAGIRVVIGIQRPDVRFFGESGESRDNFDSRLSLGRLSADGSRMMWGSSIGTSLPGIRGRAIACTSEDNAREIQAYWVPDPRRMETNTERVMLDHFRQPTVKHPPLQITIPEPTIDSKGVADVWGSILDAVMEPTEDEYELYEPPSESTDDDDTAEEVSLAPSRAATTHTSPTPQPPSVPTVDTSTTSTKEEPSATIVTFPRGRTPRRGSRTPKMPDPAATRPPPSASNAADDDPLAEYGPPATVTPDEIVDGELLELDPDRWVVVESVEQDVVNDQEWILNWRSIDPDSDEYGSVVMPAEATARCRHLNDEDS